jgi:hypothetical protein
MAFILQQFKQKNMQANSFYLNEKQDFFHSMMCTYQKIMIIASTSLPVHELPARSFRTSTRSGNWERSPCSIFLRTPSGSSRVSRAVPVAPRATVANSFVLAYSGKRSSVHDNRGSPWLSSPAPKKNTPEVRASGAFGPRICPLGYRKGLHIPRSLGVPKRIRPPAGSPAERTGTGCTRR